MPSPDLAPTMKRVGDIAARVDREARRPDRIPVLDCEAILGELTGAAPDHNWRSGVGPETASVVCLAKAVRVMASMLAATAGETVPIAGVLDDMAPPTVDPRTLPATRQCLSCGAAFASSGAGNRLCETCRHRSELAEPARTPRIIPLR